METLKHNESEINNSISKINIIIKSLVNAAPPGCCMSAATGGLQHHQTQVPNQPR
jgi:hypothetical protein